MTFDFKIQYVNAILTLGKNCGAGLATIGLAGADVGVGVVFGSLVFALSRNPAEQARLFKFTRLVFALTKAVGLLALMMAFLILFSYNVDFCSVNFESFLDFVLRMERIICSDIKDTVEDLSDIINLDGPMNKERLNELRKLLEDFYGKVSDLEQEQQKNDEINDANNE